ncbi:division/cell wall cluster transcriptional repressor MraZ [Brevirhabdus sp.]|uniref:division/cell wall cluster transcriptional repressor MraZ n=1 Tax=Brevirhabdus sp. TaxID=2004514 RepID=UPI00405A3F38
MARRFRGESHHKVDAKGRVSIPASFRRVLEASDPDWTQGLTPNVVIYYGDHRRKYLECYTVEAFEEVEQMIADLPRGSKSRNMLSKLYSGHSQTTQIDDTGRLVLSQKLRDRIGISSEAFFLATGDTFQIWEPSAYQEDQASTEDWLEEYPEDFDPLILLEQGEGDSRAAAKPARPPEDLPTDGGA